MRILYRPRLNNNRLAPLPWPIGFYRLANIVCWPLEDNVSRRVYYFERCCCIIAFIVFVFHHDAEIRYLRYNYKNIEILLDGVPTYLILVEAHIRAITLNWNKNNFKELVKKFYKEIYINEYQYESIYRKIQLQTRPLYALSSLYCFTLISFGIITTIQLHNGKREFFYKMIPFVDYTPNSIYFPIIISNMWVGLIVTTILFGEACLFGLFILHWYGRFLILHENVQKRVRELIDPNGNSHENIGQQFRRIIQDVINEEKRLKLFIMDIQNTFSFHIFLTFSFTAFLICAISFKVYINPLNNIGYICWMGAKVQEMLVIGVLGSTIIMTTNDISSLYYNCNWELIMQHPYATTKDNVRLMKLIILAMELNQQPVHLTGLNFFIVSANVVVKILRAGGSYFTCLLSFR